MPLKVVSARVSRSLCVTCEIAKMMEHGFSLDMELQFLLHKRNSQIKQCRFCINILRAIVFREGGLLEKINKLDRYRKDLAFGDAERATLAYAEEVFSQAMAVRVATFAKLRQHFSVQQAAEITLLNALENFHSLITRPLEIESDELCTLVEG